MSQKHNS
jgi:hypothetical protein